MIFETQRLGLRPTFARQLRRSVSFMSANGIGVWPLYAVLPLVICSALAQVAITLTIKRRSSRFLKK